MIRAVIAALAAAAILPAVASAQYGTVRSGPLWGERVRVTPWAGVAPRITRSEQWSVLVGDLEFNYELDTDLGAGPVAGAEIDLRVYDRFSIIGGGAFVSRGETFETDPVTNLRFERGGSDFILAKLGVAMRLREAVSDLQLRRLTATVFAAPAFIHEMPKDDALYVDQEAMNMLGANVGLNAQVPFGWPSVALQFGIEDFLIFWDNAELARRTDAVFERNGRLSQSSVDAAPTHMLLLRAGLSFRLN